MRYLKEAIELDFGEVLAIASRHARLLVITACAAGVLAFALSFLIEPQYHSYVSILPQKGFLQEREIVLSRNAFDASHSVRPVSASNSQNLVFGASYKLRQAIVDSLSLVPFFDLEKLAVDEPDRARHEAVEALRRATHFELSLYRDVLFIHVTTSDPNMSAEIGNLYLALIERENLRQYSRRSAEMRTFLVSQLAQTRGEISSLADSTAGFFSRRSLVNMEYNISAVFTLLKELDLQRMSLELALARESLDGTADNPAVQRIADELRLYNELLAKYRGSDGFGDAESVGRMGVSAEAILEASRLENRMGQLEEFEAGLAMNLANVIIETNRNEVNLPVLDQAFPASEPVWPRRWLISLCSMIIAPTLLFIVLFMRQISGQSGSVAKEARN